MTEKEQLEKLLTFVRELAECAPDPDDDIEDEDEGEDDTSRDYEGPPYFGNEDDAREYGEREANEYWGLAAKEVLEKIGL
jgi:hypothetical protein